MRKNENITNRRPNLSIRYEPKNVNGTNIRVRRKFNDID